VTSVLSPARLGGRARTVTRGRLRHRSAVAAAVVVLCSFSMRLGLVARENAADVARYYSDASSYLEPARHLLDDGAFLNKQGVVEVQRMPGYPAFLATLMTMTGRDLRLVLLLQTLILSLTPVILYAVWRDIVPLRAAMLGGMIAAVSPWSAVLATAPMSDGLFLLVLASAFLAMKFTVRAQRMWAVAGAICLGFLTGGAVLVRPMSPLVLLVPAALWFALGSRATTAKWLVAIAFVCALIPPALWRERNIRVRQFASISEVSGLAAWQYLAARVRSEVTGEDRFVLSITAEREEESWGVPARSEPMNAERWRRAMEVFRAHPVLTAYSFARSALEHALHPSPDVLTAPRLRFPGDYVVLGNIWFALLSLAMAGLVRCVRAQRDDGNDMNRRFVIAVFVVCVALTLASGISFGEGSRLRAPLEAVVPLLAGVGAIRAWERFRTPRRSIVEAATAAS
jgi:dolichyl-phosphate-mannose-protein mannosyltransferase